MSRLSWLVVIGAALLVILVLVSSFVTPFGLGRGFGGYGWGMMGPGMMGFGGFGFPFIWTSVHWAFWPRIICTVQSEAVFRSQNPTWALRMFVAGAWESARCCYTLLRDALSKVTSVRFGNRAETRGSGQKNYARP